MKNNKVKKRLTVVVVFYVAFMVINTIFVPYNLFETEKETMKSGETGLPRFILIWNIKKFDLKFDLKTYAKHVILYYVIITCFFGFVIGFKKKGGYKKKGE